MGVDLEEAHLSATGLVCALYGSEVCFLCRLALSFDDVLGIQAGLGSDSEIETLEALYDSSDAVAAFLRAHPRTSRRPGEHVFSFTAARHTERSGTKRRGCYETNRG